jgi:ATP-dependent RNA helicase DBP3
MKLQDVLRKYCGSAQKHKSTKTRVLVFVLYKKEAARVESALRRRGWSCVGIHGDKGQRDRTAALEEFRSGRTPMLVATDVAARGLDIPDVQFVINYSFPLTIEDYIHRIGRTGRAGKTGVSHTFFTRDDKARAAELTNILREAGQVIPPDLSKFGLYTKKKTHNLYGAHFKDVDMTKKATRITFD